ncbi:MAG: class I SAM-dependent methyltransferase [Bacteroidia bacterium]
MNRQRGLAGINSYEKELGFDIEQFLGSKMNTKKGEEVRWLDICCGEGKALIDLGVRWKHGPLKLVGLTLQECSMRLRCFSNSFLTLHEGAIERFNPLERFDLVTVSMAFIISETNLQHDRIRSFLTPGGSFWGNLSLENVRDEKGNIIASRLKKDWKESGWNYHGRRKLLEIPGKGTAPRSYPYLGADDQAGPNYTGQEAVNSYYKVDQSL